ncbi:demethylmenaquinone methyltransferase [Propionimicrobium sp. BV2F7]|uniref:demethylmenaquinone methyltransferase n=1 Tax=Propionimicrobium sp. BV2F7 TaxID=1111131 RepID=UPI002100836F|nr:demethylmenaquinone methyltransferase [Propionimicrobium sp. BV2F7]
MSRYKEIICGTLYRVSTRADLGKKTAEVAAMFDGVARRYDLMNDLMSFGQVRRWRRETVKAIDPNSSHLVLDLAGGTGMSSQAIRDKGAEVLPTDISLGMLSEGKRRFPEVTFVAGNALQLPYKDDSFDAVTISYGLRNVQDTAAALKEMLRVTKPGGRVVIAEFSTPTWKPFRMLYHWYLSSVMPALERFSSNDVAYDYLVESIITWPDQQGLTKLMREAGWADVQWKNLTGGIVALHRGWKP